MLSLTLSLTLNTLTENENKYHELRPKSQRKDENVSKYFVFVFHHSIYHEEASS